MSIFADGEGVVHPSSQHAASETRKDLRDDRHKTAGQEEEWPPSAKMLMSQKIAGQLMMHYV